MGARWYDPSLGRFVSPDSIVPDPANPQSFNRYSYGYNNPVKFVDTDGHFAWIPVAIVGGLIGGAIYGYGTQVYDNLKQGKNLGQALTTNIDPGKVALYAGTGALIGTGLGLVAVGAEAVAGTAGTVVTAACADGNCENEVTAGVQTVQRGLNAFSRAADFGIRSYNQLREQIAGAGLQAHHIIEQRFAGTLGLNPGEMESVALTPEEHQVFTNAWRDAIGYSNSNNPLNTLTATLDDL